MLTFLSFLSFSFPRKQHTIAFAYHIQISCMFIEFPDRLTERLLASQWVLSHCEFNSGLANQRVYLQISELLSVC